MIRAAGVLILLPALAQAQAIEVTSRADRAARPGPDRLFTGTVVITSLFSAQGPNVAGGAEVTFLPGARTAWHSHPAGQTLIVTSGVGWVRERDGERIEIRPGDVVWTPPNVEQWHGATTEHTMTHIAVQEPLDGSVVVWLEQVTDTDYSGGR